jgi:hypothetical protein
MTSNQYVLLNWQPSLVNECNNFYLQPKPARMSSWARLADQILKRIAIPTIVPSDALMTWFTSNLRTISTTYFFDFLTQFLAELSNLVDRMTGARREVFEKDRFGQLFSNQAAFFQEIIKISDCLQQNSKVHLAKREPEKPTNKQSNSNLQRTQRRQPSAQG